jgi:hypothetical protein
MFADDDAEWRLILALEILATELRRQGMSKKRIREILKLRFRHDSDIQGADPAVVDGSSFRASSVTPPST